MGVAVGMSFLSYIQAEIYVDALPLYFRLFAAIFDLPVTPTSENIKICPIVLLSLQYIGTRRKFGEITFELRHPIFTCGLTAAILNFCGGA